MDILFVAPTTGNGGIASWATNYRNAVKSDNDCILHSVGVGRRRSKDTDGTDGVVKRSVEGILDMLETVRDVKQLIKCSTKVDVIHVATSGNIGTLRDFFIAKVARKHGIKSILHCHYGCASDDYIKGGVVGYLLRRTLPFYDQIWVLDKRSCLNLSLHTELRTKVSIVPNFIDVPKRCNLTPKNYKNIAFVGNLDPTKGVYELVEAVCRMENDTVLHLIGPYTPEVLERIKNMTGIHHGAKVKIYGRLPNEEAVQTIAQMDIVALPTYFKSEAFPISILEAMSRGKLVISCPRAAIPDMLTGENGMRCGILVDEKSASAIQDAISWCQEHKNEADDICRNAYERVKQYYDTDFVIDLYKSLYKKY